MRACTEAIHGDAGMERRGQHGNDQVGHADQREGMRRIIRDDPMRRRIRKTTDFFATEVLLKICHMHMDVILRSPPDQVFDQDRGGLTRTQNEDVLHVM